MRAFDCVVCGKGFTTKATRALYCSNDCLNEARRRRYSTDKAYREGIIERVREYEKTNRAKILRARAREKRRDEGRLPWYMVPIGQLPPELRAVRRVYWRAHRKLSRGNVSKAGLKFRETICKKHGKWTRQRKFTKAQLKEILAWAVKAQRVLDKV